MHISSITALGGNTKYDDSCYASTLNFVRIWPFVGISTQTNSRSLLQRYIFIVIHELKVQEYSCVDFEFKKKELFKNKMFNSIFWLIAWLF